MICPACGYENFHPNATNCDLCHAVLKPDGKPAAPKEKERDRETMRLVQEAIEESPAGAKSGTAVKARKARPAKQKKPGGEEEAGPGGLDAALFALSLPVSFPVAVGGFFAGRSLASIPGGAWAAGAGGVTLGALLLHQLWGEPRPVWLHLLVGLVFLADMLGACLLIRRGEGNLGVPGLLASLGGVCVLTGALAFSAGVPQLDGHTSMVLSLDVTGDGRRAISGSEDSTAIVWDLVTGQRLAQLAGHREGISCARISPDGARAVTGSWDGVLKVWGGDPLTEHKAIKSPRGGITCCALSPDGKLVALGTVAGEVEVHDVAAGAGRVSRPRGHDKGVEALAFSPDGRFLASGASDGTLLLWDPTNGTLSMRLQGHPRGVRALAFGKDGRLYSSGLEGGIKVWDTGTGAEEKALPGAGESPIRALALRKDGRFLLGVDAERNLVAWDVQKLELTGKVALEPGRHPPSAVAWSDRRCLVAMDNSIQFVEPSDLGVP